MSKVRAEPEGAVTRIKLILAYDGTAYSGWQVQRIGIGVQQRVEEGLRKLFPCIERIHGSSRTDTGVHARGMVAHFDVPRGEFRMEPRKLVLALNAHLPEDVRLMSAARVSSNFHARFDASGKEYRYQVWNHPAHDPLLRSVAWHVPRPLMLDRVRSVADQLVGRHDFKCFSAQAGYPVGSTVRTVTRCDVARSGPLLTFRIEGDGFLYKMCRGLVGTMVQAGLGRIDPADISAMFKSRNRRLGGMTAPAHGLVLWKVFYRRGKAARDPRPAEEEGGDE